VSEARYAFVFSGSEKQPINGKGPLTCQLPADQGP
jgi:hypothetical protein